MSQTESSKVPSNAGPAEVETAGVFVVVSAFAAREGVTIDQIEELTRRLYGVVRSEGLAPEGGNAGRVAKPQPQSLAAGIVATSVVDERRALREVAPAIPLERAVTEDQVFCLCCGKGFTMLKRHLRSVHGLTEVEYRQMFDLPSDFPLVAPKYSKRKAEHARSSGLGKYARNTIESAGDSTL